MGHVVMVSTLVYRLFIENDIQKGQLRVAYHLSTSTSNFCCCLGLLNKKLWEIFTLNDYKYGNYYLSLQITY